MALRTRGSDVGANWVFNTNCLMPAMPMDLNCIPFSAPLLMRCTKVGPKRSVKSMSPAWMAEARDVASMMTRNRTPSKYGAPPQ